MFVLSDMFYKHTVFHQMKTARQKILTRIFSFAKNVEDQLA